MKTSDKKIAGKSTREWEELSAELGEEMAGAPENTQPLSSAEMQWYRAAASDTGPKVKVSIRLRQWQIDRAKELAE